MTRFTLVNLALLALVGTPAFAEADPTKTTPASPTFSCRYNLRLDALIAIRAMTPEQRQKLNESVQKDCDEQKRRFEERLQRIQPSTGDKLGRLELEWPEGVDRDSFRVKVISADESLDDEDPTDSEVLIVGA